MVEAYQAAGEARQEEGGKELNAEGLGTDEPKTEGLGEELSIEEGFFQLEKLIGQLEGEDISLEESFALYEKGMRLLKGCNEKIDRVEAKVQKLSEDGSFTEFPEVF